MALQKAVAGAALLLALIALAGCVALPKTKPPEISPVTQPAQPRLEIVRPVDGIKLVSGEVNVQVTISNYSGGTVLRYTLDDQPNYDIFTQKTFTIRNVGAGQHHLIVELLGSDYAELRPRAFDSVDFSVEEELADLVVTSPENDSIVYDSNVLVRWIPINFPFPFDGSYIVRLDSKDYETTTSFRSIVEGLSAGNHEIEVEWVREDGSETGVKEKVSFQVASNKPSFTIDSPSDGYRTFENRFTVSVTPKNFSIVPPNSANQPNQGHFRYTLDGKPEYSAENPQSFYNLSVGTHELKIELVNNNGSSTNISRTIRVTVEQRPKN